MSNQKEISRVIGKVGKELQALKIPFALMAETPLGIETLCNLEGDLEFIYFCFLVNGGRFTVEERCQAILKATNAFKKIKK